MGGRLTLLHFPNAVADRVAAYLEVRCSIVHCIHGVEVSAEVTRRASTQYVYITAPSSYSP